MALTARTEVIKSGLTCRDNSKADTPPMPLFSHFESGIFVNILKRNTSGIICDYLKWRGNSKQLPGSVNQNYARCHGYLNQ